MHEIHTPDSEGTKQAAFIPDPYSDELCSQKKYKHTIAQSYLKVNETGAGANGKRKDSFRLFMCQFTQENGNKRKDMAFSCQDTP